MGREDDSSYSRQPRTEVLSILGTRGWYSDHVGSERCSGRCLPTAPDPTCDVGVSLYQLRKKS